jgi:hypothetical protein
MQPEAMASRDWVRQPLFALLWWGLPLAVALGSNFFRMSLREAAWIWSGSMAVMGAGCALNAMRCHRLHCYISAPVLLLGSVGAALIALFDAWGPFALTHVTTVAIALVGASFIPELLRRRYV